MNLYSGDYALYSLSPREAVIAYYAQNRDDFNTWDYEKRYGSLAVRIPNPIDDREIWSIGNLSATEKRS